MNIEITRTSETSVSFTADPGIYNAWYVELGGAGPFYIWASPNAPGLDNFSSPSSRNDLDPNTAYDVWFRKQCNITQVTEWIGPINLPTYSSICEEPTNVVITRTSDTTATFYGADPAFIYQVSANRPGLPLRPYPMYRMNNIASPSTHSGLVSSFDYDV